MFIYMVCGFFKRLLLAAGLREEEAERLAVSADYALLRYPIYRYLKPPPADFQTDCRDSAYRRWRWVIHPRYFYTEREKFPHLLLAAEAVEWKYHKWREKCRGVEDEEAWLDCIHSPPLNWRRVGRWGERWSFEKLRGAAYWGLEYAGRFLKEDINLGGVFVGRGAVVVLGEPYSPDVKAAVMIWALFGTALSLNPPAVAAVGGDAPRLARALLNFRCLGKARRVLRAAGRPDAERLLRRLGVPLPVDVALALAEMAAEAGDVFDDFAGEVLAALGLWGHPVVVAFAEGVHPADTERALDNILLPQYGFDPRDFRR
ncbi:hypothetical protein P186_2920 [Pyrobaculum ferrireducens]|uniref:Uncharacterized protein n=2 Tax=Pyrobaculum ferrireducens TaxID=1104324 RepID=G7VG97_9CREN|nr:hypothetical protein P186_2920 [Pyrobaculum ferrireducens]